MTASTSKNELNHYFFQCIVYVDSEGEPIHELAAIEMIFNAMQVLDAFEGFASCNEADQLPRLYVHGLSVSKKSMDLQVKVVSS